ncbi:GGDEF domain-containing protein [Phaeacidiphilus oryzae]|uniref:GGDEF domain-containing protein n=1 Tax=Phaeacidiphilus oryzae TaxID=348818 RepID=UPI00068BFB15|nr:GGDEF domain-containing protein [Phaeacidiphilus oryzae]
MVLSLLTESLALLCPAALAATAALGVLLRRRGRAAEAQAEQLRERVTALELDRSDLERTAATDDLTGVGNQRTLRLALRREVAGALREDRPLAVLLLSLDGFAEVRRAHGRQQADALLREYAHRIAVEVRRGDTVARQVGAEFALLLPGADAEGAERVAARLRWTVRRHRPRAGAAVDAEVAGARITASIGCAVLPEDGRHPAVLLRAADRALTADRGGQEAQDAGAGAA